MKSAAINVNLVRRLFSRPQKLQAVDFIYREIAGRMLERLSLVKVNPTHVVDAGCGQGTDLIALHNLYPHAHMIGIDASQAWLLQAVKQSGLPKKSLLHHLTNWIQFKKNSNAQFINSDFACLPLPDQIAELVWSNMALHWHPEPDQVFKEWRRILTVDGLLMFSCCGPDTLKELRHVFDGIDQTPHMLSFIDMHDLGDMLMHAGFATPVMNMEMITLTYSSVAQLLEEVRASGGNPLQDKMQGLMGKSAWRTICDKLEQSRNQDGRIPLTLEIIYGHAFKPAAKQTGVKESVIHFMKS